jgi:hypothetical protein
MIEKQRLSDALRRDAGVQWKAVALSVVEDDQVVFAGNSASGASNTAGDLLRIYLLRSKHCQQQGIDVPGLVELIDSLAGRSEGAGIQVQPFLGPTSSVTAFWDAAGTLVGCVTILGRDAESGRRSLNIALGKPEPMS